MTPPTLDHLRRRIRKLPSPGVYDWERDERELGTPLPKDFRQVADVYGAGWLEPLNVVLFVPDEDPARSLATVASEQAGIDREHLVYRIHPESDGLLMWAERCDGQPLYWRTSGPPERWTVVVREQDVLVDTGLPTLRYLYERCVEADALQGRDSTAPRRPGIPIAAPVQASSEDEAVERLVDLVAPPRAMRRDRIDWPSVYSELGTALPRGYRQLAERYGPGLFGDRIELAVPTGRGGRQDLLGLTLEMQGIHDDIRETLCAPPALAPLFAVFPDAGGLLAWGSDDTGLTFCWVTRGEPDEWTVAVVDDDSSVTFLHWPYGGGVAQFLLDISSNRFPIPFRESALVRPTFESC